MAAAEQFGGGGNRERRPHACVLRRKALGQVVPQQVGHLAARRLRPWQRLEHGVVARGEQAAFLAQNRAQPVVDLDPLAKIERLQAQRHTIWPGLEGQIVRRVHLVVVHIQARRAAPI